jgi:opacity protein-like surface antigen
MRVSDADLEYQGATGLEDGELDVDHKTGIDLDAIVGYDFGWFRVEGELGYKRASIDETDVDIPNFGPLFDDGGKARTVSAMVNALVDFGDEGLGFYAGGGIGGARTTYDIDSISFGATDSNLAWQLIAGVRTAISNNIDLGLKYRYFTTKYNLEETATEEVIGRWKSHSLLASLVYNFAAPPPPPPPPPLPPPPPPPPPATKTCPDGSVVLETEPCPVPPPPPPPPPPAPERG